MYKLKLIIKEMNNIMGEIQDTFNEDSIEILVENGDVENVSN